MKKLFWVLIGNLAGLSLHSGDFQLTALASTGTLVATNTFSNGVVMVERASSPAGPWRPEKSTFSLASEAQLNLSLTGTAGVFRALALDLSGASDSWTFNTEDIIDLPAFAARLNSPAGDDGVSIYLGSELSGSTSDELFFYMGGPDPQLQQDLVNDLNRIIESGPIYSDQVFTGVHLSPPTLDLLAQSPQGATLLHLNRLLLEDAYPEQLAQKRTVGFTNLVDAYGLLSTIAGSGNIMCVSCNSWEPTYEGGPATNAALSSPHIAMADRAGNVYIADKRSHAIRKVTPDGVISTVAGISSSGNGDTNPTPATLVALNNPNGLWVREDGQFYILDRENGLIRKVDTNGIMTALVDNLGPITGGRGLWVSADESQIVYSAGSQLKAWDPTNGLTVFADGFSNLGNLVVDPNGYLVVTDSGANQVYRLKSDGTRTVIAGNGLSSGGGEGYLAVDTGLSQVRGVWFLPSGAYFLATDAGSQVWYVDTEAHIHLFLDGDPFGAYAGDGDWFYKDPGTPKVSFVKAVTMDYDGNLLITESDTGYVRKIQFLRMAP